MTCNDLYSVRVRNDEETGQLIISGMGELHLDIIKDRLLKEYKLQVYLGDMLVSYREVVQRESPRITLEFDR